MKSVYAIMFMAGVAIHLGCGSSIPPPPVVEEIVADVPYEEKVLQSILISEPGDASDISILEEFPVSVSADGVDIRHVLFAVAEQAGLNLVLDPDVQGVVSLNVREAPVRDVLETIIAQGGYNYRLRDGLLRVYGRGLQTRIFTVDYVTGIRTGQSRLSASSGGTTESSGSSESSGGGVGESGVSVEGVTSSNPWRDIITALEEIVFGGRSGAAMTAEPEGLYKSPAGAPGNERLVVNPLSGVILVTASFTKLNRVADLLERIEGSAHRQVMIEARIMEVSLNEEFHQGIDWSQIQGTSNDVTSVFGNDDVAAAQNLSPRNAIFEIAYSSGDFNMIVDALGIQGDVQMVSSPRLATMNNQKAIIKVAREASFFSQRTDYMIQPDGTSMPITTVEPERVTIGLILDVIPQISADGSIMMHIHPSLTELIGEDIFPPGATGSDILANAPILDIREVDAVVRVENEKMLIIGGLTKDRVTEKVTMVPYLGRIPILGRLFQKIDKVKERVELVIAIRPKIVIGEEANQFAEAELKRIGLLQ